jgi:hypothetical protein
MRRIASRPTTLLAGSGLALALLSAAGHTPAAAAAPAAHTSCISAAPATDSTSRPGRWTVAKQGSGAYLVTWTSPTRLPYSDARPEVVVEGQSVALRGCRPTAAPCRPPSLLLPDRHVRTSTWC